MALKNQKIGLDDILKKPQKMYVDIVSIFCCHNMKSEINKKRKQ